MTEGIAQFFRVEVDPLAGPRDQHVKNKAPAGSELGRFVHRVQQAKAIVTNARINRGCNWRLTNSSIANSCPDGGRFGSCLSSQRRRAKGQERPWANGPRPARRLLDRCRRLWVRHGRGTIDSDHGARPPVSAISPCGIDATSHARGPA